MGDYPQGYDGNPDRAPINIGYEFQVTKDNPKMLQYRFLVNHEVDGDWRNICPASELIDEEYVADCVVSTINSNSDYTLNPIALEKALKLIPRMELTEEQVPFLKEYYLKGGVYNKNDEFIFLSNYLNEEDGSKYLNVTPILDIADTHLNDYKTRLEGDGTPSNTGLLGSINSEISGIKTSINNLKNVDADLNNQID